MNKFENIRIMLREAQKEINELENIAIKFNAEIDKYHTRINKATDYIEKELIPYGEEWHWDSGAIRYYVEKTLEILRGEQ